MVATAVGSTALISYQHIHPKARSLVTVPLDPAATPGLLAVDLMDLHCPAPGCPCTSNVLRVQSLRLSRGEDPDPWFARTGDVKVTLDRYSGEITKVDGEASLSGPIADYLNQDKKWLTKLRKRAAEVDHWKDPDAWKSVDWSHLDNASMLSIREVRPSEPAVVLTDGPQEIGCDDWYCWNPECDCSEMLLLIYEIPAKVLGLVRIDRSSGSVTEVEQTHIPASRLRQLAERLIREASTIFAERAHFMGREFGPYIRPPVATPIKSALKVGRNDPCPCGSGKKHKKCCL